MSYEPLELLRRFHTAFNVPRFWQLDETGREKALRLRLRLIEEEYLEVEEELLLAMEGRGNYNALAKELADLLVVVYGTAEILQIPLSAVFNEVMASNMSKLGEDGNPVVRDDGKVLKGSNYRPADIEFVLREAL